jgi:hypothetical protein
MAEDDTSSREGLLNTIRILEERIASYVKEKRPASTRLSTISIVSSSIAAALTIGPAAGGLTFAETVQHGLELSQSQTVWRALCIAATMVAVVAAISANLNKSNDLTGRIKLVEGCSAELDVLRNHFELRKLSVGEALNRYEEIRARIPFIVVSPAGVINRGGTEASAPQLNTATDSFTANGTSYRAAPVRGSDTVVRR